MLLLRDRRYINLAASSASEARKFASATTTYDTARQWLHAKGFHVITTPSGNFVSEVTTDANTNHPQKHHAVAGRKRLGTGIFGDRWISIDFCFTEDGTFSHVALEPRASMPPRWSIATTASSNP